MKSPLAAICFALCSLTAAAADVPASLSEIVPACEWREESITVDVDCDGTKDRFFVARDASRHYVAVELRDGSTSVVSFVLEGNSQDSLCGPAKRLEKEFVAVADVIDMIGEVPEGMSTNSECPGVRLRSGECDSFHLYWNHNRKTLSWWRL